MTTPAPLSPSAITAVLLADGWHQVTAGTLFLYYNPQFLDPTNPTGPPLTVGGQWAQFEDTSTPPVTFGVPMGEVKGVQWTPQPGQ